MINNAELPNLQAFIDLPNSETASRLIGIPAIYSVVQDELNKDASHLPGDLWGTLKWICSSATDVMNRILENGRDTPASSHNPDVNALKWQEVRKVSDFTHKVTLNYAI